MVAGAACAGLGAGTEQDCSVAVRSAFLHLPMGFSGDMEGALSQGWWQFFAFFKFLKNIYLLYLFSLCFSAASGLSCGTRALR